eukprot:TRINITY_DN8603_c0_g1_i1.p1 TRINITY_DN8603_c0_g1~~TRINITY_DN8603_c0_g1_i1.p1  ORF type:complete len:425 (+),score=61.18 TRINITY_DN8603_c0_g1_i1:55-1275(+)
MDSQTNTFQKLVQDNHQAESFFALLEKHANDRLVNQRSPGPLLGGNLLSRKDLRKVKKGAQTRPASASIAEDAKASKPVSFTSESASVPASPLARQLPSLPQPEARRARDDSGRTLTLDKAPYFIGNASRLEAHELLSPHTDGTYLVRCSNDCYVLSVIWRQMDKTDNDVFTHVKVMNPTAERGYALGEGDDFRSINDLCTFYQNHPEGFMMRLWPDQRNTAPKLQPYNKYLQLGLTGDTSVACNFATDNRSPSPLVSSLLEAKEAALRAPSPLATGFAQPQYTVRPTAIEAGPTSPGEYDVPDDAHTHVINSPPIPPRSRAATCPASQFVYENPDTESNDAAAPAEALYEQAVACMDEKASATTTMALGQLSLGMPKRKPRGSGSSSLYEAPVGHQVYGSAFDSC